MILATAVFLLSSLVVLYVLFGYPLLLHLLSRRGGTPVDSRFEPRTVTLLMAVHNGERWLERKLESILALDYPRQLLQILVISDGSTDRTEEIVRRYASRGVQLLSVPAGGKAQALNCGLAEATGEILFFTDVRQPLDAGSLRHLVACFHDPAVGVASGELVILDAAGREDSGVGFYWRYEKWIRKRMSAIDSIFGATGSIYAMRRALAAPLPPDCLLDDVHLPMNAFFEGYRLIVEEKARAYDTAISLGQEFRRKVRTLAGVYQLIGAYPRLLTPRNRLLLHFLSHKFGRLMLPFGLLGVAGSMFGLPEPWRTFLIAAHAGIYGVAILDPWLPPLIRRGSSHVRAFLILMLATLSATAILVVPARRLWKTGS
ncbi:MAG: glycosyltransferase family 2 protein [Bryobacterales bacterium]|nr:glycosyltransferase family 2 protein [Bryobacterales bacterium]